MDPYENDFDEYDDYDQSDYYDEDEVFWDYLNTEHGVLDVCNCEQEHVKFSLKIVDYERSSMPQPTIYHLHHICKMFLLLIDEARPFAGNWTMSAAEMIKSLEEIVTGIRK